MATEYNQPIILFDGVCNLCNGAVQLVIKHDREERFLFASLQSAFGQKILHEQQLSVQVFNSFILLENGKVYQKSTAALRVAKYLSGGWGWLYGLIVFPKFFRDWVYNFIARYRYKWFGKKETCWLPSAGLKKRFLD